MITLAYSSANLVVQPLCSNTETINPFGTSQFNGQMTLNPPNDVWMAEDGRPTVLINLEDLNDHWVEGNENGFGKQWDDWSFTWSGVQVNDDNLIKNRKTSTTSNTVSRFATITSQNKTRTGIISSKPPETIKRAVGNRSVSISIIPYIRGQKVQFFAKGVKPNATFYPYFDNTLVTANTKPAYILTYTANTSSANSGVFNTKAGEQVTLTHTSSGATGIALYQNSTSILVSDLIQTVTMSGAFGGTPVLGEAITFYSDSAKTTQTATGTLQAYNTSEYTLTINSISGTVGSSDYANGASWSQVQTITVSTTGGFATGQVYQGVGAAKSNGNISAVGSSTPTYGGALTADR
jgi:hypothetical protein